MDAGPVPGSTPPERARVPRSRLGAVIIGVVLVVGSAAPDPASGALAQLLPDLRMARPTDLRITISSSGRRLLRLTTTIANVGAGPFALRASRPTTGATTMRVQQRIWRSDGTTRYIDTTGTARYAGDGHSHWHIRRVATYEIVDAHLRPIRRDAKIGFCFFDTGVYDDSLPGVHPTRTYRESGCGTQSSLTATMGISVGWGDTYPSGFAYQWIDVTGVAAGTYWVIATADKAGSYVESNEANNCSWARVRLGAGGSSVTTLARGQGCVPPGVTPPGPDPSPSPSASPAPTPSPSPGPSASPAPSAEPSGSIAP